MIDIHHIYDKVRRQVSQRTAQMGHNKNSVGCTFLAEMRDLDIPVGEVMLELRVTKGKEIALRLLKEVPGLPDDWDYDGCNYTIKTEIGFEEAAKKKG